MEQLTDLKSILHSKRANLFYLEHCRVMQKDGRVLYLTEAKNENQYWNIPLPTHSHFARYRYIHHSGRYAYVCQCRRTGWLLQRWRHSLVCWQRFYKVVG